jgi:hypothetical protein
MIWLLFIALSFGTGLLRLPWWSMLLWPAASIALGVYAVLQESPNYDMHGFGYAVGGLVALICVAAWLLGRAVIALLTGGSSHPS